MRKIESEMQKAVAEHRSWKSGNTEVVADSNTVKVYLHGNHIATVDESNSIEVNKNTVRRWPTNTTLSRLRALGVSVHRVDGVVRFIEEGQRRCDIVRQIDAAHMIRAPRKPASPTPASARRRDVRRWMQHNAHDYSTATALAEAANAVFRLPDGSLDNETHWVWDEAAEAIDDT